MTRVDRAAVLGAAALLSACGGGGAESGALPDCAVVEETVERPQTLPAEFPVPAGTVFLGERTSGPFTLVDARSPGALGEVRDFFERELQAAGFRLSGGEAEEHEAETEFAGNGAEGRLVLRSIGGCEGALRLGVAIR